MEGRRFKSPPRNPESPVTTGLSGFLRVALKFDRGEGRRQRYNERAAERVPQSSPGSNTVDRGHVEELI
jgi:hypothetical protein